MDEEKKYYKVTIEEIEESKVADVPITQKIYMQTFNYLNISEVVKRLNGGY